jgi:c(7)-type cytochrome triheme protein
MPLPEHLELPMRWTTRSPRTLVNFPHKEHTQWLDCANCHPDLFTTKQMGTVEFDKEKNLYGMYCGACHMKVAFPMNACSRCHPGQKDRSGSLEFKF